MMSRDFLAAISLSSFSIVNTRFWMVLFSCSTGNGGFKEETRGAAGEGTPLPKKALRISSKMKQPKCSCLHRETSEPA